MPSVQEMVGSLIAINYRTIGALCEIIPSGYDDWRKKSLVVRLSSPTLKILTV